MSSKPDIPIGEMVLEFFEFSGSTAGVSKWGFSIIVSNGGRSTGSDPVTDPTTLGSVVKVVGHRKKGGKMVSRLRNPDRTVHLQTGRGDYPDKT